MPSTFYMRAALATAMLLPVIACTPAPLDTGNNSPMAQEAMFGPVSGTVTLSPQANVQNSGAPIRGGVLNYGGTMRSFSMVGMPANYPNSGVTLYGEVYRLKSPADFAGTYKVIKNPDGKTQDLQNQNGVVIHMHSNDVLVAVPPAGIKVSINP